MDEALHPSFTVLLVRSTDAHEFRPLAWAPAEPPPLDFREDSTLLALVRVLARPLDLSGRGRDWLDQHLPAAERRLVDGAALDLLIPVVSERQSPQLLLALGVKRSDEPYARQDIDLLAVISHSLALLADRAAAPAPALDACFECGTCGTCHGPAQSRCARDGAPLTPSGLPRTLASRYFLERRIGRGGFGAVYAAVDTALDRNVAVKIARDDLPPAAGVAMRFTREARLAAAFVHPNVVTVHDFGVTDRGRAFLVMELLDGATLREELTARHQLSSQATLDVMRDVCSAIDAAHARRLVHRDLKPENIHLSDMHPGHVAKVLDFGIATLVVDDTAAGRDADITRTGVIIGTIPYMSPERLRGQHESVRDDVWALTVMAYEMLTGWHPFESGEGATGPAPHVFSRNGNAGLTNEARRFFETALSPDAARRPASAGALLDALTQSLAGL